MAATRTRLDLTERKSLLLESALTVAQSKSYRQVTLQAVSDHADVSHGLVSKYFGTVNKLRQANVRSAVKQEILPIVADRLVAQDKIARAAPDTLRAKAIEHAIG